MALSDYILAASVEVVDFTDGRTYGGSAAGSGLAYFLELVDRDVALLYLHAHLAGEVHKAHVGDRGQDRVALGRDIFAVFDGVEVCRAALVEIFLFLGVEI